MDNVRLGEMIEKIASAKPIEPEQIPDIDLYMDQILTFFDEKLKDFKRGDSEKILTKTMINNYSKDKVLPLSVNKKYSKKHMILLILIYHMKSLLTLGDIDAVLKIIQNDDDRSIDILNFYKAFVEMQKMENAGVKNKMDDKIKKINDLGPAGGKEFEVLTILSLILEANTKKQLAEKMIDELCREPL